MGEVGEVEVVVVEVEVEIGMEEARNEEVVTEEAFAMDPKVGRGSCCCC